MGKKKHGKSSEAPDERIELGPLGKGGGKLLTSIEAGNMVAVLSGTELMFVFIYNNEYQCFIHAMDAPEGRHRSFAINERNKAMLKNLDSAADQLFEIRYDSRLNYMGVMVAAERGIINFLDSIGQLPAEDTDFMSWQEPSENPNEQKEGTNT